MARLREQRDLVLAQVQRIAKDGSTEIVQLAERLRMASLMSADPFAKIKGMIQVKIDKATSKIAKLKQDIMTLTQELAKIAEEQQTADKIRAEEKAAWEAAEADFSSGLEGVGMALQVLRDYYAEKEESLLQTGAQTHTRVHAKAKAKDTKESGAASGIIGMLEVVESDFSKLLAEGKAAEEQAIKIYEEQTTENKIATKTKETEIKYKTKDQMRPRPSLRA